MQLRSVYLRNVFGIYILSDFGNPDIWLKKIEIIGNVHDNSELWEKKNAQ